MTPLLAYFGDKVIDFLLEKAFQYHFA